MESDPRGLCLIFNNENYTLESLMEPRTGTHVNRDQLKNLFLDLGFQVDVKDDMRGEAMKETLKNFARYEGLNGVDSLIVAFLCHGNGEKIYGVDGVPLWLQNDVYRVFGPQSCPTMIGKPKLFLVNSCRGDDRDIAQPNPNVTIGQTVAMDSVNVDVNAVRPRPVTTVTSFQDLYIAYSTFQGHVSYRNTEEGSWYINKFVEVFREQAAICDIHAMMTQVNSRVAAMVDPGSMEAQIPAPCSTLTKDWYFNPVPRS